MSVVAEDELRIIALKALPILQAQNSLYEFVRQGWPIIEPKDEFIDGMHIQALCSHLEALSRGYINEDMIINIPPRCSKSSIACVFWPAWDWLENPWRRFIFASHSLSLATRDSIRCKDVILSEWYQDNWGRRYHLIKETEEYFENSQRGYRKCASPGSRVTGEGAHIIIADDLNDTTEVFSDAIRTKTNLWVSGTLSMRLNDQSTGRIVILAQRSHELDVSGFKMSGKEKTINLVLPMEFEPLKRCKTVALTPGGPVWEDPRKEAGELLWPQKIGQKELVKLKHKLRTDYAIAGQLQQRPAPEEGGILRRNFFSWWKKKEPPKCKLIIQSWDPALTKKDMEVGSYSACTTWGIFDDVRHDEDNMVEVPIPNIILLDCCRFKDNYADLRKRIQRLAKDYRDKGTEFIKPDGHHVPTYLLIEDKASGNPLINDLGNAGIYAVPFDPSPFGDKIQRVQLFSHIMECGKVWLPANPFTNYKTLYPAVEEFLEECLLFPNATNDDYVDTLSQIMLRMITSGYLYNSSDPRRITYTKFRKKVIYGPDVDK